MYGCISNMDITDIAAARRFVWENCAREFSNVYTKWKDLKTDGLLWGDETEYFLVGIDDKSQKVTVSNTGDEILRTITRLSGENGNLCFETTPEGCNCMLETIPVQPYSGRLSDIYKVEENMRERLRVLSRLLPKNVKLVTLPAIPRKLLSVSWNYLELQRNHGGTCGFAKSWSACQYWLTCGRGSDNSEEAQVTPGVRYRNISQNSQRRSGRNIVIRLPVVCDVNTKVDTIPDSAPTVTADSSVHSCAITSLQVTVQSFDLKETLYLHDQMSVITPILISLTSGAPVFRGRLVETDSRLIVAAQGNDDRTELEKTPQPDEYGRKLFNNPRFGYLIRYISEEGNAFNDRHLVYNNSIYQSLLQSGVEENLAMYVSNMCTNDPLFLTKHGLETPSEETTDHFQHMNSMIWPLVRLKIPEVDGTQGWRLEVRPMGTQPTVFENAAFAVFIFLLARTFREFSPDFLIPMSKVFENIDTALLQDSVRKGKFFFRVSDSPNSITRMSVQEIINGNSEFIGLVPLVKRYLEKMDVSIKQRNGLEKYLDVVSTTASGDRPTVARQIREMVSNHPEYQGDSVVTEKIEYDVMCKLLHLNGSINTN